MEIKIITKNWGNINPLHIESYIQHGGYEALKKLVLDLGPQKAFKEIEKSHLVGRGGAGFPTSEKLSLVMNAKGAKYVVCNLDESEP